MRIFFCLLIFATAIFPGCEYTKTTYPQIIEADISGIWKSDDGSELRFEADGKFSGTKLRLGYVVWPDQKGRIGSGAGSWYIKFQASPEHEEAQVKLDFDASKDFPEGLGTSVYVGGEGANRTLYFWRKGDPDYEFKKVVLPPPS